MADRGAWWPVVVVLLVAVLGGLLYPTPVWSTFVPVAGDDPGTDLPMYAAVIDGLRAGGDYYEVLGHELRTRDFPRRPMFNWRTPLHLELLALLPGMKATIALFLALAVAAAAPIVVTVARRGLVAFAVGLCLLGLTLLPVASENGMLLAEVWCGTVLLLALGLRLHRWYAVSVPIALLALFFRELAAPWLVVMALVDARERRWRVVGLWAAAAAVYLVYFGVHAARVQAHLLPGIDDGVPRSWVGLGGPRFVLDTLICMPLVALLPRLAPAAGAFALAGAALAREPGSLALRVGLPVWFGFLLVFGRSFNLYWGCVGVPALTALICLSVPALLDRVRGPSP